MFHYREASQGHARRERPPAWARSLVENTAYKREDIDVEFQIRMGRARKKGDLVVFHEGQPHKQEHIFVIVEAKREDVKPRDKKRASNNSRAICTRVLAGRTLGGLGTSRV